MPRAVTRIGIYFTAGIGTPHRVMSSVIIIKVRRDFKEILYSKLVK